MGANNSDEVLTHPFFAGIDLKQLRNKEIRAPYIPKTTEPELMRQSAQQVVWLKNLKESAANAQVD